MPVCRRLLPTTDMVRGRGRTKRETPCLVYLPTTLLVLPSLSNHPRYPPLPSPFPRSLSPRRLSMHRPLRNGSPWRDIALKSMRGPNDWGSKSATPSKHAFRSWESSGLRYGYKDGGNMLYFCVICVRDSECFIFWDPQGHQDVRESITGMWADTGFNCQEISRKFTS